VRPALQRMLTDVAAGHIDVVVVCKLDRLSRSVTFAYTVNGRSQTKAIARQVFVAPGTVCR